MSIDFQQLQEDVKITRQMLQTLLDRQNQQAPAITSPDDETPLNVRQAAAFLSISPQTVYQNISKIPHRKRHGRLYFFKTELATYLNEVV